MSTIPWAASNAGVGAKVHRTPEPHKSLPIILPLPTEWTSQLGGLHSAQALLRRGARPTYFVSVGRYGACHESFKVAAEADPFHGDDSFLGQDSSGKTTHSLR